MINFNKKMYERDTIDSNVIVDFLNNNISIYMKELNKTFTSFVSSKFIKDENKIILEYNLEENIRIIIQLL